ncbi:MAG TPA: YafY family protein [Candidatus Dormibacteraeota bacterium]|nr:YafY family protein [Candidatus Dormibacteraeota bacterium]
MKSDRLVELLLLLQAQPRRTARELATHLEVSERTIYRDVDALGAAGVPVFTERGPTGGISLSDGYRRALMQFGEEEIQALFMSGSALLADLGLSAKGERALEKLRGGFSDMQRRAAESVRGRIHIDQRRWFQSDPSVERLTILRRAVWDDRLIELGYRDREGKATTRDAEPYGLVSKAGVWYLIARTTNGYRSFRVDRIVEVRVREKHFERDGAFALDAYWRETSARMVTDRPIFRALLRVGEDAKAMLCSYFSTEPADPYDGSLLWVNFSGERSALRSILAWGEEVELVEPAALRTTLGEHANAIAQRYGRQVSH